MTSAAPGNPTYRHILAALKQRAVSDIDATMSFYLPAVERLPDPSDKE